ncbi:hypothetical protein ADUPG1_006226 [Aduncisulcus paluster]|uniref:Uncharacterized protein n=1 Tax=Aduncisulcus paluster TaxID=2918883 RepID=A0ABQ5KHA4_9EUKA|nr:hypothetical protein ADUPG1_006226 [Aduncisulcus paluster]
MSFTNSTGTSFSGSYAGYIAKLSVIGKEPLADKLLDEHDPAGHYLKVLMSKKLVSSDMAQLIVDDNTFPLVKGVLHVSINSCKRILTQALFPGVLSCYTEVLVQGMVYKSPIVPVIASNCLLNASYHIPFIISQNVRHPSNVFSISIFIVPSAVLAYHKPYLLGTVSFHIFDVVSSKKSNAMFSIFSGDQTTGEVDLSLSWTYGLYGYGHSTFLRENNSPDEHAKYSLYPRVSVHPDRLGGFRIPSYAPVLTPQPSFLCAEPVPFSATKQLVKQGFITCGEGFGEFQSQLWSSFSGQIGSDRFHSEESHSSEKEASVRIGGLAVTQGAVDALKAFMGEKKFASHPLVQHTEGGVPGSYLHSSSRSSNSEGASTPAVFSFPNASSPSSHPIGSSAIISTSPRLSSSTIPISGHGDEIPPNLEDDEVSLISDSGGEGDDHDLSDNDVQICDSCCDDKLHDISTNGDDQQHSSSPRAGQASLHSLQHKSVSLTHLSPNSIIANDKEEEFIPQLDIQNSENPNARYLSSQRSTTASSGRSSQRVPLSSSESFGFHSPYVKDVPDGSESSGDDRPKVPLIEDSSLRFKRLSSELERLPLMRRKYQMIDSRRSKLKFLEKIIGLNSNHLQQTSLRSHPGNTQFSHENHSFMKYMVPLSSLQKYSAE